MSGNPPTPSGGHRRVRIRSSPQTPLHRGLKILTPGGRVSHSPTGGVFHPTGVCSTPQGGVFHPTGGCVPPHKGVCSTPQGVCSTPQGVCSTGQEGRAPPHKGVSGSVPKAPKVIKLGLQTPINPQKSKKLSPKMILSPQKTTSKAKPVGVGGLGGAFFSDSRHSPWSTSPERPKASTC